MKRSEATILRGAVRARISRRYIFFFIPVVSAINVDMEKGNNLEISIRRSSGKNSEINEKKQKR